ncbi:MAG: hypothetical protein LBL66_07365 [Clostridiales bacterium]|nr:hypothetical protein [Clostridiales bacterium]
MDFSRLQPVYLYCPNCGHKCVGYRSRDGTAQTVCGRCGLTVASKRRTERIVDMRLTAPPETI